MLDLLGNVYEEFKGAIATGLVATMGFLLQKIKREHNNYANMADGVQALLQDRLFQTCNHYIFTQGFVEVKDLNNIESLYQNYHSLGGNGTGTELYERCKQLPLVDSQEARIRLDHKSKEEIEKSIEIFIEEIESRLAQLEQWRTKLES